MEEERGVDAEGANGVWVLNWETKMWMEMGFSKTWEGGTERKSCFSLKGRRERKEGNNSHFLPCSPHLWPSSQAAPAIPPLSVCGWGGGGGTLVSLWFLHSLYDWWVPVRPGSLPRPGPDQACSGHNNAINMWLMAVLVCVRVCVFARTREPVFIVKHEIETYHNPWDALVEFPFPAPPRD